MAFMEPVYEHGTFVRMVDEHGESCLVPDDAQADLEREGYTLEETYVDKWFCHLSAAGYMDQTDWDGPYDTEDEARQAIVDNYDVDPDTGDEIEENTTFEYHINLDERGEFFADVRDREGETVFAIHGFQYFEDGFMKHKDDMDGLLKYLVQLGIAKKGDTIHNNH